MNVTCIRAGVKDLSSAALIAKSAFVESRMTGNPHFPAPVPSLSSIAAARQALESAAAAALSRAHIAVATRWERHSELERLLVQLSKYVMATAQGDIEAQLTSGFEMRRAPYRITDLQAPTLRRATRTEYEGGVQLVWTGIRGARAYEVYATDGSMDQEQGWQRIACSTRIRTEIRGLEPGRHYAFRVRAILSAGEGPFSGAMQLRAA